MVKNKNSDKGQVGIGTLIVFISLVLVAAVAAGVLLNTAGNLQEQGEQTADQSTEEVVNKLVEYQTYLSTNSSGAVNEIEMKVRKASGSNTIDLADATIEYLSGTEQETLESGDLSISTTEGSDDLLASQSERGTITVSFGSISGLTNLDAQDDVDMTIVTDAGAETTVQLTVPDNLEADSVVEPE